MIETQIIKDELAAIRGLIETAVLPQLQDLDSQMRAVSGYIAFHMGAERVRADHERLTNLIDDLVVRIERLEKPRP